MKAAPGTGPLFFFRSLHGFESSGLPCNMTCGSVRPVSCGARRAPRSPAPRLVPSMSNQDRPPFEGSTSTGAIREAARGAVEAGDRRRALAVYERLLDVDPHDAEALNYLAMVSGEQGNLPEALALLERAAAAHPSDATTWRNLGMCALAAGNPSSAVSAFDKTTALEPSHAAGHLQRGLALERCGRTGDAAASYLRALAEARRIGQWLGDDTTPPGLRTLVQHAVAQVRAANRELLAGLMAPLLARHGPDAMRRVGRMVANYVGDVPERPKDPRQRPTFLYFPGLPATPYLERGLFEWYEALEEATAGIRDEASALLADGERFEAFLGEPSPGAGPSYLAGSGSQRPRWDAHFFWRHGRRYDANCSKAPFTAAQLERLPLGKVPGHGPECLFSILGPGSEIQRHTGVTNTRVVTHLPLIVPSDCAIRVGGVVHAWAPGRCVSFDDTFEHEAWNRSDQTRVILLFDTWNPHLDEAERDAVSQVVTAISAFNARAWEHPGTVAEAAAQSKA